MVGLLLCAAALLPSRAPAADGLGFAHYESVSPSMSGAMPGGARRLKLAAFGREYHFDLRPNPRLAAAATGADVELLAGGLEGVPGSWARMSVRNGALRGMFWDGHELFVVDAPPADTRLAAGASVLFRLADATLEEGISFAGDERPTPRDAAESYGALVQELRSSSALALAAAGRLEVSVLGDATFRARYGSEAQARDEILTRMNIVDGIFSAQAGVELHVATVNVGDSVTAALPTTTDASMLLDELGLLRQQNSSLNARGLTHLFTGNDFTGNTVGIAYSDGLCSRRFAASISSVHASAALDALITAHEIGHVFGAPHDGDQECAATPQGQFIMSPTLVGSVTSFSQCSLDAMQIGIESASCLLDPAPDLSLPQNLGSEAVGTSADFTWAIRISNEGAGPAVDGSITVEAAPQLTIVSGRTARGSCAVQGARMTCNLPTIAAQGSETLTMTVRSAVDGTFAIEAAVAVADDTDSTNNSGAGTLAVSATGPTPPPPAPGDNGGGGGGGRLDLWMLLALLSACAVRLRREALLSPPAAAR